LAATRPYAISDDTEKETILYTNLSLLPSCGFSAMLVLSVPIVCY